MGDWLLTCYAFRYPDLMAGYCHGTPNSCDFPGLESHWETFGKAGSRRCPIVFH